jgi:hypothetical protein
MNAADLSKLPWDVTALAVLIVANRTATGSLDKSAVYYPIQLSLLASAGWFATQGIRGLDGYPVARWIVVALMVFHVVQNAIRRGRHGGKL